MRRIAIVAAFIVLFSGVCVFGDTAAINYSREPVVTAPSAILIDAASGQVLYEKDADKTHEPASLTQIMTALLAIENMKLDDVVTVDKNSAKTTDEETDIDFKTGEKISVSDLVYAMMLSSSNEAAAAAAITLDGSMGKFATRMNTRATGLGTEKTNFVNPHGLSNKDHYTTARDMALISMEAMKNKTFRKFAEAKDYKMPATNKSDARRLKNTNAMLYDEKTIISVYQNKRPIQFEGTSGIKIGRTDEAGYCIAASAQRDGVELIAVVLGAQKNLHYADAEELLEYGFHNYKLTDIVKKDEKISDVVISNGKTDAVSAISDSTVSFLTPPDGSSDNITIEVRENQSVNAPIKKGDELGEAVVFYKENKVGTVKLLAAESVEAANIKKAFKDAGGVIVLIIKVLIGLAAVFAIWLIYSVTATAIRRRNKRKKKNFYGTPGYISREVKRIKKLK